MKHKTQIPVAIFVRVSKSSMDFTRQVNDLNEIALRGNYNVVELIAEKESGGKKNEDRLGIKKLEELVNNRRVQKVLTHEISRLGRNTIENLKILQFLTDNKISIFSIDMGIETLQPDGNPSLAAEILFTIYSSLARQETQRLRVRIKSGLEEARRKGVTLGRKQGSGESEQQILKKYAKPIAALRSGLSIRKTAKLFDLSATTICKIARIIRSK